jgi:polyferredoxin
MLLLAGLLSLLGWFRHRIARRLWLVLTVTVIGLWAGNLVSMALISGWAAEGIGWRLAPGLCAIAFVSLLTPAITKGNPYCNHLCPHGSIQQLIRPVHKSRRRWKPAPSTMKWFAKIPGLTLVLAYVILIVVPTIDLSSWEPFHAYLFRIASWTSVLLAIATLALSAVIPMGYCRLGCPTGRLIDYLRRTSISHRITSADFVAVALLVFALVYRGF